MFFPKSKESSQHDMQIAMLKDYYEDKLRDYRIENEMLKIYHGELISENCQLSKDLDKAIDKLKSGMETINDFENEYIQLYKEKRELFNILQTPNLIKLVYDKHQETSDENEIIDFIDALCMEGIEIRESIDNAFDEIFYDEEDDDEY